MPSAGPSTGPIRTISKGKRHRIASYFRSKGIRYSHGELTLSQFLMRVSLDPRPKKSMRKISGTTPPRDASRQGRSTTLSSSGSNRSQNRARRSVSSGRGSGVEECSSGECASPAVVWIEFVRPSGRGYAPDVGDGLVGPGVPGGGSEEHLERSQAGRDRHH